MASPPAAVPARCRPCAPCRPAPAPPQIAAALRAEKLILMTDVPGVLRNKDDPSTKVGGWGPSNGGALGGWRRPFHGLLG